MSNGGLNSSFFSGAIPACNIIPVGFGNSLPSNYPISLIAGKVVIYYKDGTTETLQTGKIDIKPGAPDLVLFTSCNAKCAIRIEGTGTGINNNTQETKALSRTYLPDPPTSCLAACRFGLIPKPQITEDELNQYVQTGDFSIMCELAMS